METGNLCGTNDRSIWRRKAFSVNDQYDAISSPRRPLPASASCFSIFSELYCFWSSMID
jgi:hypothetical protein